MKKRVWMKALTGWLVVGLLGLVSGCGDGQNVSEAELEEEWIQQDRVSECGGFSILRSLEPDYCDAEILYWEYEAQSGTLKITNTRVSLNCCGQRSMQLDLIDGVYVATELDQPNAFGERCRCNCVFDFEVTTHRIQKSLISLRLDRIIADQHNSAKTAWEGEIALVEQRGFIVIDDTAAPACDR